jgi:hypothetical protein
LGLESSKVFLKKERDSLKISDGGGERGVSNSKKRSPFSSNRTVKSSGDPKKLLFNEM